MATLIPAIKGQLGNTTFYEATMRVSDLLSSVTPPSDLDEWANMGLEEKMQREPDMNRIRDKLVPYLANNGDRFFGSIIVLIWKGSVDFEPVTEFATKIPAAYKGTAPKMGFVSIDGGKLVVLDGQHRYLALRDIRDGKHVGEGANNIVNDEVCVVLIEHESDMKTRRIFNTVNRYAKVTSRGDNIITSEDDGAAIVARRMLSADQPLADRAVNGKPVSLVNWKSNTLTKRSTQLTTLSTVYDSVELILDASGIKLDPATRPSDNEIETYQEMVKAAWEPILEGIPSYGGALADPSTIPSLREDTAPTSLLFKPASQLALIDALLRTGTSEQGKLKIKDAIARAVKIPSWSMDADMWRGIIIKQNGTIDAGRDAKRRMADLLVYLIAADRLSSAFKFGIWKRFNIARGHVVEEWLESDGKDGTAEDLPAPVEGDTFSTDDALANKA